MKGSRGVKNQMKKDALDASMVEDEKFKKAYGDVMGRMFNEGMTPKDAMGVNSNILESVYAQAYRLYNTGKYIEAVHLFRVLIMMNYAESKYVLGLAACFHMMKEYKNAIQTYTMCSAIDPNTPIPYYHSSDCFIQMKDYLSAMLCLQLAIDKSQNKPEFAKIKERAILSLESLKQQNLPSQPIKMEEDEL
ncbi:MULTISPECIES: SycD/LcrH family type III secretion system chaperone [Candidatus Protochlamydia]|uniref:Low calcium response locus protein H n=1 Tax=Candidatus Protochlamydia amoebophila TaxID=362787 RepID=A0A0C1JKH6_9BACT|nr:MULTISPECIES: SycD/LcrH family type III secretion system chaperone [Protochlamydia]KIC71086.1 Low calcium response locus protein H [Candidatus Protochlamydia amoebophila]